MLICNLKNHCSHHTVVLKTFSPCTPPTSCHLALFNGLARLNRPLLLTPNLQLPLKLIPLLSSSCQILRNRSSMLQVCCLRPMITITPGCHPNQTTVFCVSDAAPGTDALLPIPSSQWRFKISRFIKGAKNLLARTSAQVLVSSTKPRR